jgi:transitional endoplasmic reticulum ATPase
VASVTFSSKAFEKSVIRFLSDNPVIEVGTNPERFQVPTDKDKSDRIGEKRLLALLAELGGKQVGDDDVVYDDGGKWVVPTQYEGKDREVLKFWEKRIAQKEEVTTFTQTFKYRPWDGAAALQSALKRNFGTTGIAQATFSLFGKNPPRMITIDSGVDQQIQVPWGVIEFPPLEATLTTDQMQDAELGLLFRLHVETYRKHSNKVQGLFKLIEAELKEFSIYKGRAITGATQPTFIDPFTVDPSKVVYSEHVQTELEANIWDVIRFPEVQVANGQSLKRSALLAGPYGTGKSLAAMLTAQVAVDNGWTFIQCRPGKDNLGEVMQTALLYQPAVVFYEDIDTVAQSGDPDKVSQLLEMFDGIQKKNTQLICVMTTNHADNIHKGMLRSGRTDAYIEISALDSPGVEKMIHAIVPDEKLDTALDYQAIGEAMEGFLPAFIAEAIGRTIRYSISRTKGAPDVLRTEDFVHAATSIRKQYDLMTGASEGHIPDSLHTAMKGLVTSATSDTLSIATINRGGDEDWARIQVPEKTV